MSDDDGGESIVTALFSYRTTECLSKQQLKQNIVRKGRHQTGWKGFAAGLQ